MKTYQSNSKDTRKNFFKRHKYAIALIASTLAVTAVIVLSVVFTLPEKPKVPDDVVVPPPAVDVDNKPVIVTPMAKSTIGMDYSDDKLVKWETLDLWQWHPAIDFVGGGDVRSIMDGTVLDVEKTTIEGNVVTIEHSDGYVSIYKSLGADVAVKKGDKVKAGDRIGTASASMTSELHSGAHLHFELKKNGKYVNPSTVLTLGADK